MLKVVEKTCTECLNPFVSHRKYKECPECRPDKYRSKKYANRKVSQKALDRKAEKAITKVKKSISLTSSSLIKLDPMKLDKVISRLGEDIFYVG